MSKDKIVQRQVGFVKSVCESVSVYHIFISCTDASSTDIDILCIDSDSNCYYHYKNIIKFQMKSALKHGKNYILMCT